MDLGVKAYQNLMEVLRSASILLNPKAQEIVKGRCKKIVEITSSSGWGYIGADYKNSEIYLNFKKSENELSVDPLYPWDPYFPGDSVKHNFPACISLTGDFKPALNDDFVLVKSQNQDYYFLSIKHFNKNTLKDAKLHQKTSKIVINQPFYV